MTELVVSDLAAALRWYRDALGLAVERLDAAGGFALLSPPSGGRLSLKVGVSVPGGARLHFEVANLVAELARLAALGVQSDGQVKASDEGYRRAILRDPDGYAVVLFEWVKSD